MVSKYLNIAEGDDGSVKIPPPGQVRSLPKPTKESRIPFTVPKFGTKTETWYALYGELSSSSVPLIVLHGGPGAAHNYLKPVCLLSTGPHARPVILYDQVGCGNSTLLPDRRGDTDFWTPGLFMAELDNLKSALGITKFDILGQSWGGMLGGLYASTKPSGLRKLCICDSPAEMEGWGKVAGALRALLPQDVQDSLTRLEKEEKTDTDEYEEAMMPFYHRFVCRVDPFPEEFNETMASLKKDSTVYNTMNGPSEFHVIGSLKTFNIVDKLKNIEVPTLLVNGKYDEAQDYTMEDFFREVPKVKWIRFAESAHMPQLEETEAFVLAIGKFLDA